MVEQYRRIKADYPDALLFYRMGDFYELFFSDAEIASRELQIALTSRNRSHGNDMPMCGVPWHAAKTYIAQLIEKGYVVAICEQTEDPKNRQGKGLVARAVTRVITPGTVLDSENLEAGKSNYLGALLAEESYAFVWADISTGHWSGAEFAREEDAWSWVGKMGPRELILSKNLALPKSFPYTLRTVTVKDSLSKDRVSEILLRAQHVPDLDCLGLAKRPLLAECCAQLVRYLEETQQCPIDQLDSFVPLSLSRRMLLDDTTERNLELFSSPGGNRATLRSVLKTTVTPMGGRLLEDMLHHPWHDKEMIVRTQALVRFFLEDDEERKRFRDALSAVLDLERLIQRVSLNRASPRDFLALASSLSALPRIKALLETYCSTRDNPDIAEIVAHWDSLEDVEALLARAIVPEPPVLLTEGGLFQHGYNQELDSLLDMVEHGEQKLTSLLESEREKSGIAKLKLGYNRVFGYYYELSRAVSAEIPEHFVRRQSLANAERFTTPELKTLEEALLTAADSRKSLEYTLFLDLRKQVAKERERFLSVADHIAHLDYWQALAQAGRAYQWVLPEISEDLEIVIEEGRHPVLEQICGRTNFVANDLKLGCGRSFCLLTGPNMAGKSTVLRQTAQIVILAQMGAPIPAKSARIGLVDKVFSRVGASDNLSRGESTFMVEMRETARILRQATRESLVILDEIGRGTSTYDGVALAWAIVEYSVRRNEGRMRTLFATHYHELTELEGRIPEVFTMNVAIREYKNDIVFLHRLLPGPSDRSYGVEVARLAGIPQSVVQRARELLGRLEAGRRSMQEVVHTAAQELLPGLENRKPKKESPPAHPILAELAALDPETIRPVDALGILSRWKERYLKG
ncbi:MAG: DNA mismatch repair protein MutS [Desulfovibrionaceae bacterium]|nr:DNA mismatch repair protein MutS [Desulfovibrionaceae bacterium]